MIRRMRSLKSRMFLFFIIIIGIVLLLQLGIFQQLISNIIMQKSNAYFQETVNQLGKRIDLQVKLCEETAMRITNNQVLKNYLKDLKYDRINYHIAKYKITREILKLTELEIIDDIYIFTLKNAPINCYYSNAILEMDSFTRYLLYQKDTDFDEKIFWTSLQSSPFQISAFTYIYDDKDKLGLLRISFNEKFLSEILDKVKLGNEGEVHLADDSGKIIFSKDRRLISQELNTSNKSNISYLLMNEKWKLIGIVPETEINNQISHFNHIFLLMVFLILLAIMIFAFATYRAILKPLSKIMRGMESIQQGNLNVMLESDVNDEFSVIIQNFNYMVQKVKSLIETIYHQQIHYQKAEMSALQAKLNPHFLYNTLDMIYWMLILKDEENIGNVVIALSEILRYSISHENEFVTVREDIGQLESYLKIQKMRFEDKLEYSFDICEDMLELKIPKLLIQPLIENSIKYAFGDMKSKGAIHVEGYLEENDLVFAVSDNGIGMSQEKIESIFSTYEFQNKKTGIGIQLVNNRIKYIYGEEYGISIMSTEGEGTRIMVRLRKRPTFTQEELLAK